MQPKVRRNIIPKVVLFGSVVGALLLCIGIVTIAAKMGSFMRGTSLTPSILVRLLFDTGAPLKKTDNKTNILLLGIPGGTHAGPTLTDSITVLSLDRNKSLTLVSLPRDIWSETLKDKINSAYFYGEEKKKGGGMLLSKVVSEDVIGIPIHYALVVDFSGFKRVIDEIGGIDVAVARSFIDPEFPIEGKEEDLCNGDRTFACRYETVQFQAGMTHMDGMTALKYIRSRHAEGQEGTDFARGRRQQEVILALKQKLTTPGAWMSFDRIKSLTNAFDEATDTDMNIGELLTIGKIMARIGQEHIGKVSIQDLLYDPPLWQYDGKYVLVPREGFPAIHEYIKSKL